MDLNEVLLWMAGPSLAVLALQGIAQARQGANALLTLVLAIGAVGLLAWAVFPGSEGAALVALILLLVILPALATVRLFDAFDARRWGMARCWLALVSVLHWLPGQRPQLAVMRHIIALESGVEPPALPELGGLARLSLDVHRLTFAARWQELAALVEAQPAAIATREPSLLAARLRAACELGHWDEAFDAYRALASRAGPARLHQRALHGARVALLAAAGEADGVAAMCAAMPMTAHDDVAQYFIGWARWARGDEAPARMLLDHVAAHGSPRLRASAAARLAHPPASATSLPDELRALARAIASGEYGGAISARRPARLMAALVMANVAVYAGMLGANDREAALLRLGALCSRKLGETLGVEGWWRFGASLFLHVNGLHLAMNMIGLLIIGGALERRFGPWRLLPLYLASGLLGNVAWWISSANVDGFVVGASGCIMGLVGALAVTLAREWRAGGSALGARVIVFQIALQWVFDASHPEVAGLAHLGGLIGGALLALALLPKPTQLATR